MVDLPRARRALEQLDRLAAEHPHLLGQRGPANRAGWENLLQHLDPPTHGDPMAADTKLIAFRLPTSLVERIDAHAAALAAQTGLEVTRTDTAKMLLVRALDAAEAGGRRRRGDRGASLGLDGGLRADR